MDLDVVLHSLAPDANDRPRSSTRATHLRALYAGIGKLRDPRVFGTHSGQVVDLSMSKDGSALATEPLAPMR